VSFERTYAVRNSPRKTSSSGRSRIMVDVEIIDGLPHVSRQRETVWR
jgi:hypothetical protein